ncbi:MAG: hypothetical protein Q8830_01755 [Candidatus Phytoplasma australasiaticum]|nr:hypothetical protein [Candidatus Phytoplasma australasiaticum]MDV3192148.1 hypothetical protein [Candidatus Phytoplasma australasiaticum]
MLTLYKKNIINFKLILIFSISSIITLTLSLIWEFFPLLSFISSRFNLSMLCCFTSRCYSNDNVVCFNSSIRARIKI